MNLSTTIEDESSFITKSSQMTENLVLRRQVRRWQGMCTFAIEEDHRDQVESHVQSWLC